MLISGTDKRDRLPTAGAECPLIPKKPAALINLCAFPAVPQGKRNTMVNYTCPS
jgi:hypothetical protein